MQKTFPVSLLVAAVLALPSNSSAEPADATVSLADSCIDCHGYGGMSSDPATPSIAGMSTGFLIGAMLAYRYDDDISTAVQIAASDSVLQDVVVMARRRIPEPHIPVNYGIVEVKALANYYAEQQFVPHKQVTNAGKVADGKKLHDRYCEKCHEDGGRSTADDVGRLAGQWQLYLSNTLADFVAGEREMPKKMAKKIDTLRKKAGDEGLDALTHFYAAQ